MLWASTPMLWLPLVVRALLKLRLTSAACDRAALLLPRLMLVALLPSVLPT